MSSLEIESFRTRFKYEFDRLLETIADLDDEAVNWKPPAPGANSLLVLVTHALGSAEQHVIGEAAGKTVVRNRDAEFASKQARIFESFHQVDASMTRLWG